MGGVTAKSPHLIDYLGVQHAYDAVAEDYAAHLPDTRAEAQLDLDMIDAFAETTSTGRDGQILDAGCGTGRMSRYLTHRGCSVQGVDLSPGMIAVARRVHPDVTFSVGSLADLPFPNDLFAGVLLWYSIIHTPPPGLQRVITESTRVLRPGGHLLIGSQAGRGTQDVSEVYRRHGHEITLERYRYTADQILAQMRVVGAREVSRLVRKPQGNEKDEQVVLLAQLA
jgi:ubiquinone/menaquinone biosynthesis C-methylase UbiE